MDNMIHFKEIKKNEKVTLVVAKGLDTVEFYSKAAIRLSDDTLLIDAVRHKGNPVSFNNASLIFTLIVRREPLPVRFSGVEVMLVKYHGKPYHQIRCKNLGAPVNRRGCFRVYIGLNGTAQIGNNNKPVEAIIKDVSLSGFSIVTREDRDVSTSSFLRMVYTDDIRTVVLQGNVVRKEESENGRVVYGCTLLKEPKNLGKYLNNKQMAKLKR